MAIRTIDPTSAYRKREFVDAMKDLNELERILQGVSSSEGNWNPDLRKDLGNLSRDNQKYYTGMSPDQVINDTQEATEQYQRSMIAYVKNHFYTLLRKIDDKTLFALAQMLPLAKPGNKALDEIVELVSEKKKIDEAARKQEIGEYVAGRMKSAEEWRKKAYFGYSATNSEYNIRQFQDFAGHAQLSLNKAVTKENGELDKAKLYNLIKASYEKIVADKGIGSNEAKAYQLAVAKFAYEKEKA